LVRLERVAAAEEEEEECGKQGRRERIQEGRGREE
jgi:hypothetical protein